MPHLSLAVMHHGEETRYRTNEEIKEEEQRSGKKRYKRRTWSLVAQLLSPLSLLFSIPALSEHWFVQIFSLLPFRNS